MIPTGFAQNGQYLHQGAGPAPTRFQVLGERSSGTNYVKRLLGRNTTLKPTEALGWKHGFCQATAIPANFLVICVVRDARNWLRSMHAKPWHTPPALQEMEFGDFIRAPWATIIDRDRYFEPESRMGFTGQPLQHDRHPMTGAVFDNLLALRTAKIQALLSYQNRGCHWAFLRMEDAIAAPEALLDNLRGAYDLPAATTPFRPVVKRLGSKFKPAISQRPETPAQISKDDLTFMRAQLDLTQETALGYDY